MADPSSWAKMKIYKRIYLGAEWKTFEHGIINVSMNFSTVYSHSKNAAGLDAQV
jgi:hypothetical protein